VQITRACCPVSIDEILFILKHPVHPVYFPSMKEGGMAQADYAAVLVLSPVSGQWELMSSGGRVIVFDTWQTAWDCLPLLGKGRLCRTDFRERSITFLEISREIPNRARVVCPYAPEERTPWKGHVIWNEWL
jgi:hypothetical protein